MDNYFEITFGFWEAKHTNYFDKFKELDNAVVYQTKSKIVKADNEEKAETKLRHNWTTKIDIIKIKKHEKEREI